MEFRYEIKIPFRKDKIHHIKYWINNFPFISKHYPDRFINSCYYDTPFLKCANDNLSGISKRLKFRSRHYNNLNDYNFEIKEKNSSLGTKFRCKLQDYNLSTKKISSKNFIKNISFYTSYVADKNLLPIIEVNYKRSYYLIKNIRLTIDQNINYRDIRFFNRNYISHDNQNILEIKFDQKHFEEAKVFFKKFPFRAKRNSKYLRGLSMLKIASYI